MPVAAAIVEVAVEVDEAGGHEFPRDIHDLGCFRGVEALGDRRHLPILEGDIPAVVDVLGRVNQCPALQ